MTTTVESIDANTSRVSVNGAEAVKLTDTGPVVKNLNGGQLAGLRNKILNGGCQIAQRGNVVLAATSSVYGGCDRFISTVSGTTVSAVALQAAEPVAGMSSTGLVHQIGNVVTTGTTTIAWSSRLEASDVRNMNGKKVTFSGKIYQTSAATIAFVPIIEKANAADNFSAKTTLFTGSIFNVAPSTVTEFSYTVTLGATDASNGLQLNLYANSIAAQSGSYWSFSDLQFEIGETKTPFEVRPYALENSMCLRYYRKNRKVTGTAATATDINYIEGFELPMRSTPSATLLTSTPYAEQPIFVTARNGSGSSIGVSHLTTVGCDLRVGGFSGMTVGAHCLFEANQVAYNAEL
jgi:hypothetical protein